MRMHPFTRGAAAVLLFALPALPAMAARFELQGGVSYMDSYSTPAAFGEVIFDEHSFGSSNFTWAPDITAGWISGRDLRRYDNSRYTTRDDIGLVAAGVRIHYGPADAWYRRLFISEQPTVHTGRTEALSSAFEFTTTVGYQANHWSVGIRHISNAGIHEPNRGETMAVVGIAF
ncbi:MAG TPA: acyloxyacyl hydrolase [Dyella sp.]|uniref:acyloxyacyl hydrolase n=1 Tax=Dyella sp. TaxID=1869338 RepID=UPI002BD1A55B|nr:acyloxyacyl hydrolase [Dyella sp.]HUB89706.1 acyloxyacyl hydrolase [Dyella sp.]